MAAPPWRAEQGATTCDTRRTQDDRRRTHDSRPTKPVSAQQRGPASPQIRALRHGDRESTLRECKRGRRYASVYSSRSGGRVSFGSRSKEIDTAAGGRAVQQNRPSVGPRSNGGGPVASVASRWPPPPFEVCGNAASRARIARLWGGAVKHLQGGTDAWLRGGGGLATGSSSMCPSPPPPPLLASACHA